MTWVLRWRSKSRRFRPGDFDEGCVRAVRNAAERLGYSHRDIISGAGHDACWINQVAPTAMIMCPCVDGLSHNEAEEITPEWASRGGGCAVPCGGRNGGDRGVIGQCGLDRLPCGPASTPSAVGPPGMCRIPPCWRD